MISQRNTAASSNIVRGFTVATVTTVLALALFVYLAASRGWIPAANQNIAAVMLAALTAACAALLIRQIRARLREPSESSPLLLPTADWYMRLARRSGRPLGVIGAVAQVSDGCRAPPSAEGQDRALSRSLKEALRSVDLVVPSIGSDGAMAWIVCPDTDAQAAQVVEQRLRHVLG